MVSVSLVSAVASAVAVTGFVLLLLLYLVRYRVRLSKSKPSVVLSEEKIEAGGFCKEDGNEQARRFGWLEIESLTSNFSEVIGSGGFSTVFLGKLGGGGDSGSGSFCAVKVLRGSERLNVLFRQELDILLRLRHRNIVPIIGYCDERDEGALVFEYVPGGNLRERLHDQEKLPVLAWSNRLWIAYQLAQAIDYLHDCCALQIVHGDIKSSNILLDECLNCRLCDFGSAKMGFSSSVLPSSPTLSPRTRQVMLGSPGYTDPHYLRTGIASKKNDIYSFGVIILELITGMEAFLSEKMQMLTSIVAEAIGDSSDRGMQGLSEMVDPQLGGEIDLKEAETMISIARSCLHQSSSLRPSARQVIETMRNEIASIHRLESKYN